MSYKIWFEFQNDPPATNAQAFATESEAESSARNRFMQWTRPTGYHIKESDEPVNYKWDSERGDIAIKLFDCQHEYDRHEIDGISHYQCIYCGEIAEDY